MKKIALLLAVVILGTAAMAAPPKPATSAAPAAPAKVVIEEVNINVPAKTSSGFPIGKLAIGDWGGWASLKYQFNQEIVGTIGATLLTGNVSRTDLMAKIDYNLAKVNQLQPAVGVYIMSIANASTVGVSYGVSTMILSNLAVGFDILVLDNGSNVTTILPGAVFSAAYYL